MTMAPTIPRRVRRIHAISKPRKPSSSAITAKRKSVCASGKQEQPDGNGGQSHFQDRRDKEIMHFALPEDIFTSPLRPRSHRPIQTSDIGGNTPRLATLPRSMNFSSLQRRLQNLPILFITFDVVVACGITSSFSASMIIVGMLMSGANLPDS